MDIERLKKREISSKEGETLLEKVLNSFTDAHLKVYLISFGNHSKQDYVKFCQETGSQLLICKSFLRGWLKILSFIPASWAAAIVLNKNCMPKKIIDLSRDGDIFILVSDSPNVKVYLEEILVELPDLPNFPSLYRLVPPDAKTLIVNAEQPGDMLTVHLDFDETVFG